MMRPSTGQLDVLMTGSAFGELNASAAERRRAVYFGEHCATVAVVVAFCEVLAATGRQTAE